MVHFFTHCYAVTNQLSKSVDGALPCLSYHVMLSARAHQQLPCHRSSRRIWRIHEKVAKEAGSSFESAVVLFWILMLYHCPVRDRSEVSITLLETAVSIMLASWRMRWRGEIALCCNKISSWSTTSRLPRHSVCPLYLCNYIANSTFSTISDKFGKAKQVLLNVILVVQQWKFPFQLQAQISV